MSNKKPGRPKGDNNKDEFLMVRLTREEKNILKAIAAVAGYNSISEYIRDSYHSRETLNDLKEYLETYLEITRPGSDLSVAPQDLLTKIIRLERSRLKPPT